MKKILVTLCFTLGINLFGFTETLKPEEININILKNNDVKVAIDCSPKSKNIFGQNIYSEKADTNIIMRDLCKSSFDSSSYQISLGDFNKLAEGNKRSSKIIIKDINDKNPKLFYRVYIEHLDYRDDYSLDFPVTSLDNANMNIRLIFKSENTKNMVDFNEENLIKNYKYDIKTNKITTFELEKPFNYDSSTITNSYNIDDVSECINGEIWVKKYGAKSGQKCNWIRKN